MTLAYYIILLVNSWLCGYLLVRYFRLRSPFFFMWLALLIVFFFPSYFDPFVRMVNTNPAAVVYFLDMEDLVSAQLVALICLIVFLALELLLGVRRGFGALELNGVRGFDLAWVLLLLVMCVFSFFEIFRKFGLSFWVSFTFVDRREGLSFLSQFFLTYNFIACSALSFVAYRAGSRLAAVGLWLFYLTVFSLLGGSRQPLVALILPFFALYLYGRRKPERFLFYFVVGSNLVLFFLSALIVLRYYPSFGEKLEALGNFGDFYEAVTSRSDESDLRFVYYFFVKEGMNSAGFGMFEYFLRICFFWLPSALDVLSLKPADFEYVMFAKYMLGESGTMHPILFGSIYADSLMLFPVWAVFFWLMVRGLHSVLHSMEGVYYVLFWGVLASCALMFARGALYGPFVVSVFSASYFWVGRIFGRGWKGIRGVWLRGSTR